MAIRPVMFLCVATLCMGLASCQKLGQDEAALQATREKIETLKSLDGIPAEFGNLVGVTSNGYFPRQAQLWFEKPDKTIVVVRVDFSNGGIWKEFVSIPRR